MPLACIIATLGFLALLALVGFFYSRCKAVANDYNDLVDEYNDQVDELDESERIRKEQMDAITELQNLKVKLTTERERADQYAQNLLRRLNECHENVEQLKQFQRDLPIQPTQPTTELGQIIADVRNEKRKEAVGLPPLAPRSRLVPESKSVHDYCAPVQPCVEPECDLPAPSIEATVVDQVANMLNNDMPMTGGMTPEDVVKAELDAPTHVQSCTPVQTSGEKPQPTPNDWA